MDLGPNPIIDACLFCSEASSATCGRVGTVLDGGDCGGCLVTIEDARDQACPRVVACSGVNVEEE